MPHTREADICCHFCKNGWPANVPVTGCRALQSLHAASSKQFGGLDKNPPSALHVAKAPCTQMASAAYLMCFWRILLKTLLVRKLEEPDVLCQGDSTLQRQALWQEGGKTGGENGTLQQNKETNSVSLNYFIPLQ